jgi:hypothetical protein
MSGPEIGTEEWLAATAGRLTPGQATALAAAGFAQLARERVSRSRGGTPRASEQAGRLDVARRELDGVLVTERQHVVDRQGETLLHHGCRTYLLGVLLVPATILGIAALALTAEQSLLRSSAQHAVLAVLADATEEQEEEEGEQGQDAAALKAEVEDEPRLHASCFHPYSNRCAGCRAAALMRDPPAFDLA